MRKVLILLAAPLALCALPASAQQHNNYTQNSATSADPSGSGAGAGRASASDQNRRICMDVQLSNSRITRRVCRTAREWQAQGGLDHED